jgi:hypothetical protein
VICLRVSLARVSGANYGETAQCNVYLGIWDISALFLFAMALSPALSRLMAFGLGASRAVTTRHGGPFCKSNNNFMLYWQATRSPRKGKARG